MPVAVFAICAVGGAWTELEAKSVPTFNPLLTLKPRRAKNPVGCHAAKDMAGYRTPVMNAERITWAARTEFVLNLDFF